MFLFRLQKTNFPPTSRNNNEKPLMMASIDHIFVCSIPAPLQAVLMHMKLAGGDNSDDGMLQYIHETATFYDHKKMAFPKQSTNNGDISDKGMLQYIDKMATFYEDQDKNFLEPSDKIE